MKRNIHRNLKSPKFIHCLHATKWLNINNRGRKPTEKKTQETLCLYALFFTSSPFFSVSSDLNLSYRKLDSNLYQNQTLIVQ